METDEIAFGNIDLPVIHDWRLRVCDYGSLNGASVERVDEERLARIDVLFGGGYHLI